jgi:hypothetical protein
MLAMRRTRSGPADPVAPVIDHGSEIIVTEPIALMRELAIAGRPRDDAWLTAFMLHARKLTGIEFAEADIHPISACWRLDADRFHMHISVC